MDLAKRIRLKRIFSHPSGRLCSVAVDHFIGYQAGLPAGLVNVPETIAKLVAGRPDAITMLKGMAQSAWEPFAGQAALIIQAGCFTPDDAVMERLARPEEALRLGADGGYLITVGATRGKNLFEGAMLTAKYFFDALDMSYDGGIFFRSLEKRNAVNENPETLQEAFTMGLKAATP